MNSHNLWQNACLCHRYFLKFWPFFFSLIILICGLINAHFSAGAEGLGYPVSSEKVVIDKNKFDFKGTLEKAGRSTSLPTRATKSTK